MNSLQNLIQRLSAIGQVTEAEEKCSKCGCTPCECDDKEKVEEAKKPDDDNDGVPNWADKKKGEDDNEKVDEAKKPDADGDGVPDWADKKEGDDKEVKESALNLLRRYAGIQEAAPVSFDKVLDAIAALYGDDIWENDAMQDLADDLEQAGPTDRELDFIIAQGKLPKRLAGIQFSAGDNVQFGEGAMDTLKALGKKALDTLGHPDDEEMIKDMQRKAGVPVTGKKPESEPVKEDTTLNVLRQLAGIQECGDMPIGNEMSPMTTVANGEPHMGIPAEVMAQMSAPEQGSEMAEPEGPHMEVPMAAEAPKATYTLSIQNGENNLQMTTDMPDEIIHIMKLAGVNKGAEVTKKETPATGEEGEQEVEESGYENTPDNTQARDPQAHGDIRDWGQKGTAKSSTHYTPAQSGDNPMNEQRMFQDYKNFKAGK